MGEQLDVRVAFSEGLANALAATILGDSEFVHSFGPGQGYGARFSIEDAVPAHPGWFSEDSVMGIVHDLLDPIDDDGLELGFGAIYEVLVNDLRETPALTSVFAFIHALKTRHPEHAATIDSLVGAHRIEPIVDAYGSTETNSGYPPSRDTLPVYSHVAVNGRAVNVCSTPEFRGSQARGNSLGAWRFVRLEAEHEDRHTMTVTVTDAPRGTRAPPVMELFRTGWVGSVQRAPEADCTLNALSQCAERMSASLPEGSGEYVLAVAEASNASRGTDVSPVGRTCMDVKVARP